MSPKTLGLGFSVFGPRVTHTSVTAVTLMGKKEGEDENDVVEEVVVVDARLHPSARQVILLDDECNHFSVRRNHLLQCDHIHCKLVYVNCLQTY